MAMYEANTFSEKICRECHEGYKLKHKGSFDNNYSIGLDFGFSYNSSNSGFMGEYE